VPRVAPILGLLVVPRLRELRGERKLLKMEEITGVAAPILSQIERGERYPRFGDIRKLERGYGPMEGWYTVRLEAQS
jgi:transcriptional regulator with XRE-family HTH domain